MSDVEDRGGPDSPGAPFGSPDGSSRGSGLAGEQNPFLRYRSRLATYRFVEDGSVTDDRLVDIIAGIDERVAAVWGHGFAVTPLIDGRDLARAGGVDVALSVKLDLATVGGSHKSRHLMGVMILDALRRETGSATPQRLAISSCGNAAIGAAVIARAMDRPLDVFVPTWADAATLAILEEFGAHIHRCERRAGEVGDPCYLRFREATAVGQDAAPFGVQSTDTPATIDGATTIGFEVAEQVEAGNGAANAGPIDALYVQVGGGALATATGTGLAGVRLFPVQAEGCAPLERAWRRWGPEFDVAAAAAPDQPFMTAWDNPHSAATGILDDITYDWIPLLTLTRERGGHPIVAPEALIERAHELAHAHTDIDVSATGTAGLAGLLAEPAPAGDHVAVLFTGIERR